MVVEWKKMTITESDSFSLSWWLVVSKHRDLIGKGQ